jgi:prepilin-type N-terminal cleavage/methylation domain-containing protein
MKPKPTRIQVRGFTLIELLSVIAIIGILAGIIIPVVGGVRNSAKKAKTRVQFSQWGAGFSLFKNTYGYFPRFDTAATNAAKHKVNGGLKNTDTSMGDDDYLFREILSGKGAKWTSPDFVFASDEKPTSTNSIVQNKKRTEFVKFDISEITSTTGGDSGDSEIRVDGALKDTFGNVEIVVLVDRNGDGLINKNDLATGLTEYPSVRAKGGASAATLKSAKGADPSIEQKIEDADSSKNGVRADVIFYSPGKGGKDGTFISYTDAVWSW